MSHQNQVIVRSLDPSSFAAYGEVVTIGERQGYVEQIKRMDAHGWIWATSRPSNGPVTDMGFHPNSDELFIPVIGSMVIVVAPQEHPEDIEAFHLSEPVLIRAGVWHFVSKVTENALLYIIENADVTGHTRRLNVPVSLQFGRE